MHEMSDFAQQEEPESETRSRSVSFPDHYLLPYIEWCKRSKYITCSCSIMFFGIAIFCFFATNYMINYPATLSRKIVFVFAATICIICGVTCLELRFRILKQCREGPEDNIQFEIARRDTFDSVTSSFSGYFETQETPFCNGTSKEPSQAEMPEFPSRAHSLDEASPSKISTFRHNGLGSFPRRSISGNMSPDSPLLPLRKPIEISKSSLTKNGMDFTRIQNGRTVPGSDNYLPNYSTFENESDAPETKPLLSQSIFENESDAP
ncbi:uncharacterized protein LOC129976414 [Argiope bruennichi]|uniref:uncharacterized protein LOC129976414 n=1 Tax=Argiope bruennichi TaxID=94029 RepID=UPI002494AD0A|nr:uncharacterized protein LOC129976414 [Argiope bruennichi]